jgi:hypothetical protein
MHMASSFRGDNAEGRTNEVRCNLEKVVAVHGVHYEIKGPRLIAARDLAVAHDLLGGVVSGNDPGKALTAALTKVKPEMVVEGSGTIGTPCRGNECRDLFHGDGVHVSLYFE